MTDILKLMSPSSGSARTERSADRNAVRNTRLSSSSSSSSPSSQAPPLRPPTLRRNTTLEIEAQLDETLSTVYEKNLLDDCEIFASQTNLKLQHHYYLNPPANGAGDALHMKEIMKELSKTLPNQLEVNCRGAMFVRFDEER